MTAVVFPSSTNRDLHDERATVLASCRALNLAVATMEDFPATSAGATQRSLAQCYGYVEPGHATSVTEAEYAHQCGLDCLCFFLAYDAHPAKSAPGLLGVWQAHGCCGKVQEGS